MKGDESGTSLMIVTIGVVMVVATMVGLWATGGGVLHAAVAAGAVGAWVVTWRRWRAQRRATREKDARRRTRW